MEDPADPRVRLVERLSDPLTVSTLNRLLDRLDVLASVVDSAASRTDAPAVAPEPPAALARLVETGLADRLAEPKTQQALATLLDKLPTLNFAVEAFEGFLQRGELMAGNLGELLGELKNVEPPLSVDRLQDALAGLPKVVDAGLALIKSGLFDPEVVAVLVEVGHQAAGPYREAKNLPDRPLGPIGLFRSLLDPDIQRAFGVGIHIVKRYGQTFNRSEVSPPPSKPSAIPANGHGHSNGRVVGIGR